MVWEVRVEEEEQPIAVVSERPLQRRPPLPPPAAPELGGCASTAGDCRASCYGEGISFSGKWLALPVANGGADTVLPGGMTATGGRAYAWRREAARQRKGASAVPTVSAMRLQQSTPGELSRCWHPSPVRCDDCSSPSRPMMPFVCSCLGIASFFRLFDGLLAERLPQILMVVGRIFGFSVTTRRLSRWLFMASSSKAYLAGADI